jgi:hypothetical protein
MDESRPAGVRFGDVVAAGQLEARPAMAALRGHAYPGVEVSFTRRCIVSIENL